MGGCSWRCRETLPLPTISCITTVSFLFRYSYRAKDQYQEEIRDCLSLRQSQQLKHSGLIVSQPLGFRLWGRQLPGGNGIGESAGLMRAIAERLVCGVPATAEPDSGPSSQAKWFSLGIKNFEIAFHAYGSIVIDSNFRGRHFFSWTTGSMPILPCSDKLKSDAPRPGRCASHHAMQISAEESVFCNGRINLVGPREDAALQVKDFAETRLTQEVHGLGGTLPAAAMRDNFLRRIEFMYAPGQLPEREQTSLERSE